MRRQCLQPRRPKPTVMDSCDSRAVVSTEYVRRLSCWKRWRNAQLGIHRPPTMHQQPNIYPGSQWSYDLQQTGNPLEYAARQRQQLCHSRIEASCALLQLKGVMTWAKVTSLVGRFWSLPWTNGPNIQFKWKLRYSPIHCPYLEPSTTYFSDHRHNRTGPEIGN